jgi:hypothetical protein
MTFFVATAVKTSNLQFIAVDEIYYGLIGNIFWIPVRSTEVKYIQLAILNAKLKLIYFLWFTYNSAISQTIHEVADELEKDLEGMSHALIELLFWHRPAGNEK